MNDSVDKNPFISVIVPVYNGEYLIANCIESLLAMDYPQHRREVIIVDNNSNDRTSEIIARYPVVSVHEHKQGPSAARNAGVQIAKGHIIATTDADCCVDSTWAMAIEKAFEDTSVDGVIGFAEGINETIYSRFFQRRWEESWFTKTKDGYVLKHKGVDSRNCAIRKSVLKNSDRLIRRSHFVGIST